jgi:protein-tyrosine phosphatase
VEQPELDPPLRVDWIGTEELDDGRPGRLGLTFLPGKRGISTRYAGRVYRRDLDADLATLENLGVGWLLLLVDDAELARFGDHDIVGRSAEAGVTIVRRPLADGTAPRDPEAMDEILRLLDGARERGDVAVACMGGVGRTGTVAACALVASGHSAAKAVARVRAVRHPEAVETAEQVTFVRTYERHIAEAGGSSTLAP